MVEPGEAAGVDFGQFGALAGEEIDKLRRVAGERALANVVGRDDQVRQPLERLVFARREAFRLVSAVVAFFVAPTACGRARLLQRSQRSRRTWSA